MSYDHAHNDQNAPRDCADAHQMKVALSKLGTQYSNKSVDDPDRALVLDIITALKPLQEVTPESLATTMQSVLSQTRFRKPQENGWGPIPGQRGMSGPRIVPGTGHQRPHAYYNLFHQTLFNKSPEKIVELSFASTANAAPSTDFFRKAAPQPAAAPEKKKGPKQDRAALTDAMCTALAERFPKPESKHDDPNWQETHRKDADHRYAGKFIEILQERRGNPNPLQKAELGHIQNINVYVLPSNRVAFNQALDEIYDAAHEQVVGCSRAVG